VLVSFPPPPTHREGRALGSADPDAGVCVRVAGGDDDEWLEASDLLQPRSVDADGVRRGWQAEGGGGGPSAAPRGRGERGGAERGARFAVSRDVRWVDEAWTEANGLLQHGGSQGGLRDWQAQQRAAGGGRASGERGGRGGRFADWQKQHHHRRPGTQTFGGPGRFRLLSHTHVWVASSGLGYVGVCKEGYCNRRVVGDGMVDSSARRRRRRRQPPAGGRRAVAAAQRVASG
jgi:hypothetical protein